MDSRSFIPLSDRELYINQQHCSTEYNARVERWMEIVAQKMKYLWQKPDYLCSDP